MNEGRNFLNANRNFSHEIFKDLKNCDFTSLIVELFTFHESIRNFHEVNYAKFFRLMMTFKSFHLADMFTMKNKTSFLPSRCVYVCGRYYNMKKLIINLGMKKSIQPCSLLDV